MSKIVYIDENGLNSKGHDFIEALLYDKAHFNHFTNKLVSNATTDYLLSTRWLIKSTDSLWKR